MVNDPVGTAASHNPLLSTLTKAATAANLVDTLNSRSRSAAPRRHPPSTAPRCYAATSPQKTPPYSSSGRCCPCLRPKEINAVPLLPRGGSGGEPPLLVRRRHARPLPHAVRSSEIGRCIQAERSQECARWGAEGRV
jgi:hypothetical protein